jgi:hypothetical protein
MLTVGLAVSVSPNSMKSGTPITTKGPQEGCARVSDPALQPTEGLTSQTQHGSLETLRVMRFDEVGDLRRSMGETCGNQWADQWGKDDRRLRCRLGQLCQVKWASRLDEDTKAASWIGFRGYFRIRVAQQRLEK